MRAGDLRERVSIQVNTPAADTFGAAGAESWANIGTVPTVYAALEPLSGREGFAADRLYGEASHRVRMRYRSDFMTVLVPKNRLLYGTRVFDIIATLEVAPRQELHVLVTERV